MPCSRSHSRGVRRRTTASVDATGGSFLLWQDSVPQTSTSTMLFACVSVMHTTGEEPPTLSVSAIPSSMAARTLSSAMQKIVWSLLVAKVPLTSS